MRRMHWWGAAAGVGALAVAAVGVPSALAHPGTKPQPKPVVAQAKHVPAPASRTNVKVVVKHGNHRPGHWNPRCEYPPHGRPDVKLEGQTRARRGSTVAFRGTVKINGCGYENQKAGLFRRVQKPHQRASWVQVGGPATTAKDGSVTFSVKVVRTADYRIFTAPGAGLAPGLSEPLTVQVKGHDERVFRR